MSLKFGFSLFGQNVVQLINIIKNKIRLNLILDLNGFLIF